MQVLVIGAGVVGLACARAAAVAGHEVIVAEATGGIGNGVSSRNSEVIHAGMYDPTGSWRAKHCVRGRRMLYEFCASHGVPHKKIGKLIVATDEKQTAKIEGIAKQGEINGVEGLEFLGGNATRAMFESNFPVDKGSYSYPVFWNACKILAKGASAAEKHDLFFGTAKRFYRLDGIG